MDAEWCTFALQWALFLELGVIEMGKSDGAWFFSQNTMTHPSPGEYEGEEWHCKPKSSFHHMACQHEQRPASIAPIRGPVSLHLCGLCNHEQGRTAAACP